MLYFIRKAVICINDSCLLISFEDQIFSRLEIVFISRVDDKLPLCMSFVKVDYSLCVVFINIIFITFIDIIAQLHI